MRLKGGRIFNNNFTANLMASASERILKIGPDLTELPPRVWYLPFLIHGVRLLVHRYADSDEYMYIYKAFT